MITVTLQLRSAISARRDRCLGSAVLANDGTGTSRRGNYEVRLRNGHRGKLHRVRVENFPRASRSAWELVRRALNAAHAQGVVR